MAGSTTKKVVIRRFDRESLTGFVNPLTYLQVEGLELLSPSGELSVVPYHEIKLVSFVREFGLPSANERKVFLSRPKINGLWVRMTFRDGELLEGVLSNDLLQLPAQGFPLIPPDTSAGGQRLFVPREAVTDFTVLGVVGGPAAKRKKAVPPREQIGLFEEGATQG